MYCLPEENHSTGFLIDIPLPTCRSRGYLLNDEEFDYGKLALLHDIKVHNKSLW
jgi:hypothetical protein